MSPITRSGQMPVEVGVVPGPDGLLRVLMQLPDGFVLMRAVDARNVAAALIAGANHLDQLAKDE